MIIEIDENNIVDINSAIKTLVNLKKTLSKGQDIRIVQDRNFQKKFKRHTQGYNSIVSLYESPITKIFGDDIGGEYYVYFHCDPNAPINAKEDSKSLFAASLGLKYKPFYVGKGINNRCFDTSRNDSYAKKKQQINRSGKQIEIVKIKVSLSESQAFAYESKFIDIFGLISYGPNNWLVNLDEGMYKEERRLKYKQNALKILLFNKSINKSEWLKIKQFHSRKSVSREVLISESERQTL